MFLSIIICTYNRADILDICLNSLVKAKGITKEIEIIVVNNNSHDHTEQVARKYRSVKYFKEQSQGLSHARNKGVNVASGDWILFIDDDCKVKSNIIHQVISTIKNHPYKLFTGIFKAWYLAQPPKWISYKIGNYFPIPNTIQSLNNYFVAGGVMILHKKTFLDNTNGFPTNLGMNGENIGYGEETYIENIYRDKNIPLGINPNIVIYHQVLPFKYTVKWQLDQAYAKGKTFKAINDKNLFTDMYYIKYLILSELNAVKGFILKPTYFKKWVIKGLSPIYFLIGYLKE